MSWSFLYCAGNTALGSCANIAVRISYAGFANEGQFLMISTTSLADVAQRVANKGFSSLSSGAANGQANGSVGDEEAPGGVMDGEARMAMRFRPNFVVGGGELAAYEEDGWETGIRIGPHAFQVEGVHGDGVHEAVRLKVVQGSMIVQTRASCRSMHSLRDGVFGSSNGHEDGT